MMQSAVDTLKQRYKLPLSVVAKLPDLGVGSD